MVRPLNVWASTFSSDLELRERAFLSWIAPRGIVAAAVASLFAAVMEDAGMQGGSELRALVFLTIAVTVLLQGISAGFVAGLLGVRAPGRDGVAILGADELALTLGDALAGYGNRIVFLDSNPAHIRAAEERGYQAIYGNALEERTLSRARLEHIRVAVGLTPNDEINGIFAREASEEFSVPETFVAINRRATRYTESRLERQGSLTLFDRPKDVERWSVRIRQEATEVHRYVFEGTPEDAPEPEENGNGGAALAGLNTDPFVLLATVRGDQCRPMHSAATSREGDLALVLVFAPELEEADATLAERGWVPAGGAPTPTS